MLVLFLNPNPEKVSLLLSLLECFYLSFHFLALLKRSIPYLQYLPLFSDEVTLLMQEI